MAAAGRHQQVSRQLEGMIGTATGHLVETVAVDVGVSIRIVANRRPGCIIVPLAVVVADIAATDLFTVGIAMDW